MLPGGYGEVVNTNGCEPFMREFEPHYPPQLKKYSPAIRRAFLYLISIQTSRSLADGQNKQIRSRRLLLSLSN